MVSKDTELTRFRGESSSAKEEAARQRLEAEKSSAKVAQLEAKLKDVQSDFDCQRHNSEATRLNLEKKLKDQA